MNSLFLFPLLSVIFLDMLGRFFVKMAFDKKDLFLLGVSAFMYILLVMALFFTFYYKNFAKSSALWDSGTLIISILIGRFIFQESFTWIDMIGFTLITSGFLLLSFF